MSSYALRLPPALAAAPAPSLAALHLARVRLAGPVPAGATAAVCCARCSALAPTDVRLVRSRRAKARAALTQAGAKPKVANVRLVRCRVCGHEARTAGSDRATVDGFPGARQAARARMTAAAATATGSSVVVGRPAAVGSRTPSVPPPPSSAVPPSTASSRTTSPAASPAPTVKASPAAPSSGSASAARKKKPQSSLQKMLALKKAQDDAAASASASSGLLDWL